MSDQTDQQPGRAQRRASVVFGGALVVVAIAATAVQAGSPRLPDLVTDAPENVYKVHEVEWPPGSGDLRLTVNFDGFVHNLGDGPLILKGNPQPGALPGEEPHQYILQGDGITEAKDRPVHMYFATEDGHYHWHVDNAMEYSLWNLEKTEQVTISSKVGFCMLDSQQAISTNPPGFETDPARFAYDETNCAYGADQSEWVEMGVSVGWRDVYSADIEFQWIDVSDVSPGEYYVAAVTDPLDSFTDADRSNNGIAFSEQTVVVPGYRPADASSTFDGGPVSLNLAGEAFDIGYDPATDATIDRYFVRRGPDAFATVGPKVFEITTQPEHGTVTVDSSTGRATYTPDEGFEGADSFDYTVYDVDADYPRTHPVATIRLIGPDSSALDRFTDVTPDNMFLDDIEWLTAEGITVGCRDTLFCPDAPVTRAQMATFLTRALATAPSSDDVFTDDDGNVHEANIQALAAAGITVGCDIGLYCPNQPVTRAQMATFLVRALDGVDPVTGVDTFGDDDDSVHEANIEGLFAAGITTGCDTGRYCPDRPITRAQMAAFLHRALG